MTSGEREKILSWTTVKHEDLEQGPIEQMQQGLVGWWEH